MTTEADRRPSVGGLVAGVVTATAFGLGGFFLMKDSTGAIGPAMFLVLPFAAGFAIALVARPPRVVASACALGLLLCFAALLVTRAEGWVCVLMATPLIAAGLAVGGLFGYLFRKHVIDKSGVAHGMKFIALLVLPFLVAASNRVEQPLRNVVRTETFLSTLSVDAPVGAVWDLIKDAASIDAPKPFLLRIGLPVPQRCVLDRESVDAKRTCYFDSGYIEERITQWDPPRAFAMDVVESRLPGRHWLGFKSAAFKLRQEGARTVLTRETTITSRLYPAWYWRPLEKLGVTTEHTYLFDSIIQRLGNN
jgi:hypothetical protein